MFTIETISNRVVKGAALVTVESFIIVDETGALVSGTKAYDTREEAQAKMDSMGHFSEGLAFARAMFPSMAEKALIGKANTISAYLDWVAAGRPAAAVAEEAPAEASTEVAVVDAPAEEAFDADEEF